jgi:hypothetical protein
MFYAFFPTASEEMRRYLFQKPTIFEFQANYREIGNQPCGGAQIARIRPKGENNRSFEAKLCVHILANKWKRRRPN